MGGAVPQITMCSFTAIGGQPRAGLAAADAVTGSLLPWAPSQNGSVLALGAAGNFLYVGATTLLTKCYRSSERAKVQALNDFLVFGTVAIASFSSGRLLSSAGWDEPVRESGDDGESRSPASPPFGL